MRQHVQRPTGGVLQFDADVQQNGVGRVERGCVVGEQDSTRRFGPFEGVHIAHAASTLLEVGFEQERDLTRARVPRVHAPLEVGEPAASAVLPLRQRPLGQLGRKSLIAGKVSSSQQSRGRVQVVAREL